MITTLAELKKLDFPRVAQCPYCGCRDLNKGEVVIGRVSSCRYCHAPLRLRDFYSLNSQELDISADEIAHARLFLSRRTDLERDERILGPFSAVLIVVVAASIAFTVYYTARAWGLINLLDSW